MFLKVVECLLPGLVDIILPLRNIVTLTLLFKCGAKEACECELTSYTRNRDLGILAMQCRGTLHSQDPAELSYPTRCPSALPALLAHGSGPERVKSKGLEKAVLCSGEIALSYSCCCQWRCLKAKKGIMGKKRT